MSLRIHARAACVAALALIVIATPSLYAAEKRAVLVGINDYTASRIRPSASALVPDRDWGDLQGAVNDVGILREMLVVRYGFNPANIVTLSDQEATRAAILGALDRNLRKPSKKDDVAFFYYSGHGSQVENSRSDEPDRMDESIVPADSRVGGADIRDKELRRVFNGLLDRGARVTAVFDNCHSGSGARGFDGGLHPRSVKPDFRDVADGSNPGPRPEDRGALVMAAAQDFDYAYETRDSDGKFHGAFSWALENALRDSSQGEPAIDTFLRAQARLRLDVPVQEPMIAGNAEARLTPFLSARGERPRASSPVAVERANGDGTYVLQGGWVNGITIGSVLETSGVRLEVIALRGIGRCDARVKTQPATRGESMLQPGTLLNVAGWAAPPGRPLHVWVPVGPQDTISFARDLQREATRRGIRWIADPTESPATHLIRWRDGRWEVLARGETSAHPVGAALEGILGAVPRGSSVFVQLPVPPDLIDAVGVRKAKQDGIEVTSDSQSADYILAGRFFEGRIEYAWLRRALTPGERCESVLPLRSRWKAAADPDTPLVLGDAIMRLRRIFGWHHLESPHDPPPYNLALRRAGDGSLVEDGLLVGQSRYGLVLRARGTPSKTEPRFVYVFVIDSLGKSILLFPLSGSVENRMPMASAEAERVYLPPEIPLGERASFTITPPYGVDTYFLLTTDEALPDPWALQWNGVRSAGERGTSPLQQLLAFGGTTRSPLLTPPHWSIEKLVFESVPPQAVRQSGRARHETISSPHWSVSSPHHRTAVRPGCG